MLPKFLFTNPRPQSNYDKFSIFFFENFDRNFLSKILAYKGVSVDLFVAPKEKRNFWWGGATKHAGTCFLFFWPKTFQKTDVERKILRNNTWGVQGIRHKTNRKRKFKRALWLHFWTGFTKIFYRCLISKLWRDQ